MTEGRLLPFWIAGVLLAAALLLWPKADALEVLARYQAMCQADPALECWRYGIDDPFGIGPMPSH